MSQSVLISTFFSRAKPRLSALPWPRMPMLADDDAIVGAEDAAADVRRRLERGAEELAAERNPRRRRADAGGEFTP